MRARDRAPREAQTTGGPAESIVVRVDPPEQVQDRLAVDAQRHGLGCPQTGYRAPRSVLGLEIAEEPR